MSAAGRTPVSQQGPLVGFGPGKVILLGEHSVVYGHPALAAPLSYGITARGTWAKAPSLVLPSTLGRAQKKLLRGAFDRAVLAAGAPALKVTFESELPLSMGLGSSAALSVACARLLLTAAGAPLTPATVSRVALQMEQEFHGTPSGVDHTTSAEEHLVLYRKSPEGAFGKAKRIQSRRPLKALVALVGERSPTWKTVAGLRERQAQWPERYRRIFEQMGKLAVEGARAVEEGELEALGDAMNVNHGLLSGLGLSSLGIDEMVYRLRELGALGAKLTGAGGDGGAVVGLFLEPEPAVAKLTAMGVRCFGNQLGGPRAL